MNNIDKERYIEVLLALAGFGVRVDDEKEEIVHEIVHDTPQSQ